MKIAINQSYFFPYIGYFQLIDSVDKFIIYDYVTFRKKSWITRNKILDKGTNSPLNINVPVIGKSSNKLIREVHIYDDIKWKKKLLNMLFYNYKKAPFFNEVYPFFERIIALKENNLHYYNSYVITEICKLLEIDTQITYDNSLNKDVELGLINKSNNKLNIKTERIIRLCNKYNKTIYVNSIGGTKIYDKNIFNKRGIDLLFIKMKNVTYSQSNDSFVPNLSIVDMLMYIGVNQTKEKIKEYYFI